MVDWVHRPAAFLRHQDVVLRGRHETHGSTGAPTGITYPGMYTMGVPSRPPTPLSALPCPAVGRLFTAGDGPSWLKACSECGEIALTEDGNPNWNTSDVISTVIIAIIVNDSSIAIFFWGGFF